MLTIIKDKEMITLMVVHVTVLYINKLKVPNCSIVVNNLSNYRTLLNTYCT
jgi:hypothetical protein